VSTDDKSIAVGRAFTVKAVDLTRASQFAITMTAHTMSHE